MYVLHVLVQLLVYVLVILLSMSVSSLLFMLLSCPCYFLILVILLSLSLLMSLSNSLSLSELPFILSLNFPWHAPSFLFPCRLQVILPSLTLFISFYILLLHLFKEVFLSVFLVLHTLACGGGGGGPDSDEGTDTLHGTLCKYIPLRSCLFECPVRILSLYHRITISRPIASLTIFHHSNILKVPTVQEHVTVVAYMN
jgi:hypothetical protein